MATFQITYNDNSRTESIEAAGFDERGDWFYFHGADRQGEILVIRSSNVARIERIEA